MKKLTIPLLLAVIVGLGLIVSSLYWTSPLGPQPQWTEEQALQHQRAGAAYHRAKGHSAGPTDDHEHDAGDGEAEIDMQTAREEWERQDAMLQAVQSDYERVALTLWWSGVVLASLGVIGFLFVRPQSE